MSGTMVATIAEVQPAEWEALAARRVYFGHQSVGRDVLLGVERVLRDRPEIGLRVVAATDPREVRGPALIDARIGRNRHPETKADAFEAAVRSGLGAEPGAVAMYKYCYVDVLPETDPDALFADYRRRMEALRAEFPGLTVAHWTLPLHAAPEGIGERVRTRLGRQTQTALNVKRNRYNELLRGHYAGREPVFDLALLQSTRADGSRAFTLHRGEPVHMLAPEWTYDGGHLNDQAQYRAAEQLLAFLARLPAPAARGDQAPHAGNAAR